MTLGDTIVAISSAVGEAARIIVRLSGPKARAIVESLSNRTCHFSSNASVVRSNLSVDSLVVPAWIYSFIAPHSYTGEDLIELHLPGNPLLARMSLDACQRTGARPAEAGEFTARAYFNGRLDLSEVEGVAAVIAAHGEAELAAARQLLAGELSRRLEPAMELLADTLALVEVGIDFVEEDVTFLSAEQIGDRLARIDCVLAQLQSTSGRFEKLTHEPRVVLVGRPNAGKSTLLNALAGHERAIVSPIAGTTRDALSVPVFLRRGTIQLMDVAGMDSDSGQTRSDIHQQMQQQAKLAVDSADVRIAVEDSTLLRGTCGLPVSAGRDSLAGRPCHGKETEFPPHLTVMTKTDLTADVPPTRSGAIHVSALTGDGMQLLRDELDRLAFGSETPGATLALTARHWQAIESARAALARAGRHAALEVLAADLRDALDSLGQILGVIAPDDLLGRIFSAFCIGK